MVLQMVYCGLVRWNTVFTVCCRPFDSMRGGSKGTLIAPLDMFRTEVEAGIFFLLFSLPFSIGEGNRLLKIVGYERRPSRTLLPASYGDASKTP
jgi:hypothetical protein